MFARKLADRALHLAPLDVLDVRDAALQAERARLGSERAQTRTGTRGSIGLAAASRPSERSRLPRNRTLPSLIAMYDFMST